MFISEAFAEASGAASGDPTGGLWVFGLIFVVFYFLLIRPQQKRAKEHKSMIESLRRGDVIVTAGGIIAKVSRVTDDNEVEVEIAQGIKVKVMRSTISTVQGKPVPANDTDKK